MPLKRRQALAMIAAMDDGLGRLRAKLKEMGLERDTLIIFIGDNGAPLGDAWNGSSNRPLVGQKGMLSEGGIRVPFVGAWPGRWPAGATYDHPVSNLDVAATAVAQSGQPRDEKLDGVDLTPFVTGANAEPPHQHLFWRWGSQAAVLEMPYKLIKLGNRPSLLFDVSQPDGENIERNLAARHPETVARLERRLEGWAAELQPPGLSTDNSAFSRRHEELFTEHQVIAYDNTTRPTSPATPQGADRDGNLQGWIARNGKLAFKDGVLALLPEDSLPKNARPFITHSMLDIAGPATVTLRVRAREAGQGPASITWRTRQASFEPQQSAAFDWPDGAEWREVRVQLSERSRIIHIRITPPKAAKGIEIQTIELQGSRGAPRTFRFDAP